MDKEYALYQLRERIAILKKRYHALNNCKDEWGGDVKPTVAYTLRHNTKREMNTCMLLEELITTMPGKLLCLTDGAMDALEKIMEPLERHRRLKDEINNADI